jgi:hypothetical protein
MRRRSASTTRLGVAEPEDSNGIDVAQERRVRIALALVLLLFSGCNERVEQNARPERPAEPEVECVDDWSPVADGIEYRTLNCRDGGFDLHLVRVDPRLATIDAVVRPGTTATNLGRDWTFAINANFFDENFRPLGVVTSQGRALNPPHPVSWQSVFYVDRDRKAGIVPVREWDRVRDSAVTAAQCGPRLVVNGERNSVARADPDSRAGVCIDSRDRVVFFATPPAAHLDVLEMVSIAAKELQCRDAMLFDGGPSTQMFLRREGGPAVVEGDKRVPAYVVVNAGKR